MGNALESPGAAADGCCAAPRDDARHCQIFATVRSSPIADLAPVGVDLTPGDALEMPGVLLPGVALRCLEPPADVLAENPEAPTYYLCLAADNRYI